MWVLGPPSHVLADTQFYSRAKGPAIVKQGMDPPLHGLRVLECGLWQQVPLASMMLGDMGAEVIKIERPRVGDPVRSLETIGGVRLNSKGPHFYYTVLNQNKKSVTLDLANPKSSEVVRRLMVQTDVFIHNMRPEVAERLGVGYETLYSYNPKLIYAAGSGYGPEGPDKNKPSIDPTLHARAGLMQYYAPEGTSAHFVPGGIADNISGVMLAYGVLAALVARERTGAGQKVDVSILGSVMWAHSVPVNFQFWFGQGYPKWQREQTWNPMYNYYRCQDDQWMFLGLMESDAYWPTLCEALSITDMMGDPRFYDAEQRNINREALIKILDQVFASHPYSEWASILGAFPDIIFERVGTMADLQSDPQVTANEYILNQEDPLMGSLSTVGLPVRLSGTPTVDRLPAPELGEHTEEVLTRICGFGARALQRLHKEGVI